MSIFEFVIKPRSPLNLELSAWKLRHRAENAVDDRVHRLNRFAAQQGQCYRAKRSCQYAYPSQLR